MPSNASWLKSQTYQGSGRRGFERYRVRELLDAV